MWVTGNDRTLTRDHLLTKGWKEEKTCSFCDVDESINHLFCHCPVALQGWHMLIDCGIWDKVPNSIDEWYMSDSMRKSNISKICCVALF